MGCPEVIVHGSGNGRTGRDAFRMAIDNGRLYAVGFCRMVGDDCRGVEKDPVRVELATLVVGPPIEVKLKLTFKCSDPPLGCLYFFLWPILFVWSILFGKAEVHQPPMDDEAAEAAFLQGAGGDEG